MGHHHERTGQGQGAQRVTGLALAAFGHQCRQRHRFSQPPARDKVARRFPGST
jgi:hypothetical protein